MYNVASENNNVGLGESIPIWQNVHASPFETEGAAGSVYGSYQAPPWNNALVRLHGDQSGQETIAMIDATNQSGVSADATLTFANSVLPAEGLRQAAFESFATGTVPQGWGSSSWLHPTGKPLLLFVLGPADGSGNVGRAVSTEAKSTD